MEWKIGEIRQINGEGYQCVEDTTDDNCNNCCFQKSCNYFVGDCSSTIRSDGKTAAFKKLEKVGEPYEYFMQGTGIILVQEYILASQSYICGDEVIDCQKDGRVAIEIKEDMEENKTSLPKEYNPLTRIVYAYVNGKISDNELIKSIKEMSDEYPYNKNNIKPFSLEAAKLGKPVCTRDGCKARIICFDSTLKNYPLVVLVDGKAGEYPYTYTAEGKFDEDGKNSDFDLMMLPEKKEGWVNIDKGGSGKITISSPYSTKEEAIHNDNETTIDTIKIEWEE